MEKGILYFTAPWCQGCQVMSPLVDSMQSRGLIRVRKVNVDYEASLPQQYNVRSVPTMILTDLSGNEIKRRTGSMTEQQILDFYKG